MDNNLTWLDYPFSLNEIRAALDSVRLSSSPGMDRIEYRLLKIFPDNLLFCLLSILNLLFSSSSFPAQWSHSIIHLIPKAHRSGFRPISFTSCVLKIMERMILNRIY
ncbi:RNA-directed DNA polymerase from mobile element jockey [Trachymyrmex zeteki]|uniref:RNA-directed DNA polymerase from mobile element jockey n=1 Tax=Mycetomoellerius zeteki TaxID=64791 RepID=A0A151WKS7_9HYME|nr:RNA-directed DNA polymerase from mobile element jockey [Trachymyrmex zeteki]KYQ48483.1 RNA-directed DNA polymerase from mobile element jockey [Trachymyrmex zeteki]